MKWKFTLLAILISASGFAQKIKLDSDSILAHEAFLELEAMATKLHGLVMKGEMKAYKSDSLSPKGIWTVNEVNNNAPKDQNWFRGFSMVIKTDDPLTIGSRTKWHFALAPMYSLIIDGHDLGNYPLYFMDMDQVASALSATELEKLHLLSNLLVGLMPKYNQVAEPDDGYYLNEARYSEVWDNAFGRPRLLICDWSLKIAFRVAKENLTVALENAYYDTKQLHLFDDSKFKNIILPNTTFSTEEVLVIQDASGDFVDTTVQIEKQFSDATEISKNKEVVKMVVRDQTVYAKWSEVEAVVPKWVFVLLME